MAQLGPWGGILHLFSDAAFTQTTYADATPQAFTIYVVHSGVVGSPVSSVQFMVEATSGIAFTWLSETSPFAEVIGDSKTGIYIYYAACLGPDPGLVLQIQYFGIATSEPCSKLRVVPDPESVYGEIEVVTCNFEVVKATGGELLVNCPVPVEQTTWGKVKSLYR
jgi:hypothetical protein